MELNTNNWTLAEVVTLPRQERPIKKNGTTSYARFIGSRYVCIREATDGQPGILLKVLGKMYPDQVKIVGGEPFSRDDFEELFFGNRYASYPFPTAHQVSEVIGILRQQPDLLQKLESEKMHVNPDWMFWVNETVRNALVLRIPQVYDSRSGKLQKAPEAQAYYRITMVYFQQGNLSW